MHHDDDTTDFGTFPADDFTNWLSGVCAKTDEAPFVPQRAGITAADLAPWPVADVLALAFDEGQPDRTRIAAIDALRAAYDAHNVKWLADYYSPERQARLNAIMGEVVQNFMALSAVRVVA